MINHRAKEEENARSLSHFGRRKSRVEDRNHRILLRSIHFFFSLGSQVSLVSTDQVGDFCVVTIISSLSLFFSLSLFVSLSLSLARSVYCCFPSPVGLFFFSSHKSYLSLTHSFILSFSVFPSSLRTLKIFWSEISLENFVRLSLRRIDKLRRLVSLSLRVLELHRVSNSTGSHPSIWQMSYEPLLCAMPIVPTA